MHCLIFENLEICWVEGSFSSNVERDFLGSELFREKAISINVGRGMTVYVDSDDPDCCKKALLIATELVDNIDFEIMGISLINSKKIWPGQTWLRKCHVATGVQNISIKDERSSALTGAISPTGGGCSL